jgi:hypothetical protein
VHRRKAMLGHHKRWITLKEEEKPSQDTNPVPLSWTITLQNCEKINFYYLSHPVFVIVL